MFRSFYWDIKMRNNKANQGYPPPSTVNRHLKLTRMDNLLDSHQIGCKSRNDLSLSRRSNGLIRSFAGASQPLFRLDSTCLR